MSETNVIRTEVTERVGVITLNRPETRNALNHALMTALDEAVASMAEDPEVKVVVLTGAAPEGRQGGFCSGGDTKIDIGAPSAGVPMAPLEGDLARHETHAAMRLHLMAKPTIAMVGGPAVGAGFSLAGACDLRFASEEAVFATNFTVNGLSGDYGGSLFWTQNVGTAMARRLYLLNERFDAHSALELGLVHAVVPAADLEAHTMEVASRLVRTPAALLALVKDNLNQAAHELEHRRLVFATEAANQAQAGRLIAARMKKRAAKDT